jgi:antitoxin HicB
MSNQYVGSSFDDFLEEEELLSEVSAEALKRIIAWQIQKYITENNLKKTVFAKRLHTSRSQLDRLLDPGQTNLNLKTLVSTARAMGKHIEIRFAD